MKVALLNVVGLTDQLLPYMKHTQSFFQTVRPLRTVFPAVTCSVQATFMTGLLPKDHGIVGNGWYFPSLAQVWLWRQSNYLIQAPKFWDELKQRDPSFKVAKLFWWFNMYSSADISVTPRPSYLANGRKIPDIYTRPRWLREALQKKFGPFPLFRFWGPLADITSTRWICQCAKYIWENFKPHLNLVYLPHLDYNLQRFGPDLSRVQKDLEELDEVVSDLIQFYLSQGVSVFLLSEYAILPVSRPVHINKVLRQAGFLEVHKNYVGELLDAGASSAFAVSDHQIAHVYVLNKEVLPEVKKLLENLEGVECVLGEEEKKQWGIHHPRSGDLVALAKKDAWFTYYYWLDDQEAPDFARTVDIHQKPGYDPVELFFDPSLSSLQIFWKILKQKLGFRTTFDVIPLKAELVRGSHGWVTEPPDPTPLLLSTEELSLPPLVEATEVAKIISTYFHTKRRTGQE